MITLLFGILISYIIGSIPSAYIVSKLVKGVDIRKHGSGNVGATNVFRVIGKRWGAFVLLLDMLKGVLSTTLVFAIFPATVTSHIFVKCIYGVAAIVGHNWTIFLKFKGGKGVATTTGVVLSMFPKALGMALLFFIVVVKYTKYISLGSIIAAFVFPFLLWLFYRNIEGFYACFVFSLFMVSFLVYRHRSNIVRLIKGTENKISFK